MVFGFISPDCLNCHSGSLRCIDTSLYQRVMILQGIFKLNYIKMLPILICCSLYGTGNKHQYSLPLERRDQRFIFPIFLINQRVGGNITILKTPNIRELNAHSMVSTVSPLLPDIFDTYKN